MQTRHLLRLVVDARAGRAIIGLEKKEVLLSPIEFLREGWSKLRRFYLVHFRPDYVEKMLKLRRGECRRCGNCCTIMIRCPHLEGDSECTVYDKRARQCRAFPIDSRDLRGRLSSCGHYFISEAEAAREADDSAREQSA
jgi:hypothetical protein